MIHFRQVFLVLFASALLTSVARAQGAEVPKGERVNLQGTFVTPQYWIFGQVVVQHGKQTMISLGWLHGLTEGNFLLAMREFEGKYTHLGWMSVSSVKRSQSLCKMTGKTRLKKGDWVIIPAGDLDLWHGNTAMNEDIIRRLDRQKTRNGYSTLNLRTTGAAVKRVMAAEAAARADFWNRELIKIRPDLKPGEERETATTQAVKQAGADGKVLTRRHEFPTERDWIRRQIPALKKFGWVAIPPRVKKLSKDPLGRELLLPKLQKIRKTTPYWLR